MKIILDTNVLIHIEDPKELPRNLQYLLKIIREHGHQLFIHPASLHDLSKDSDIRRKKVILSKLMGYPLLESPPQPTDKFLLIVGFPSNLNEKIDDEILFAIYKNTADFLITEDHGLHKKALKLNLDNRALSVDSALEYFKSLYV